MVRSRLFVTIAISAVMSIAGLGHRMTASQISTGAGTPTPSAAPPPAKPLPPTTPATVHGRVVAADTGKALHRARVHLQGMGNSNDGLELDVLTDRDGQYRFQAIPAGRYTLQSSKAGFLDTSSDQQPGLRYSTISVAAGEARRVDFALPRGAVISGRITDDAGEPLASVQVTALRFNYSSSGVRLFPGNAMPFSGRTDDRGEFRLPGLSPGTYLIVADYQTNAPGESFAMTYYPGTLRFNEARRFRVGVSEQVTASFTMLTARQVRVTGQARSSTGESFQDYRVTLRTETMIGSRVAQLNQRTGTFEFEGVPPGSYTLDVSSNAARIYNARPPEFASVPLDVGDQDVSGLLITTGSGVAMSGRVIFEGNSPRSAVPERSQQPRVYATIVGTNFGMRSLSMYPNNGVIAEDGSFTIRGGLGKVLFRIMTPLWELKSVTLDGVDITDVPYDTTHGGTDRLEIVVTDQRQVVKGRVVDALGRPPNRFVVIAFPSDQKEGAVLGRFVTQSGSANPDGTFELGRLPPGSYFAAALASLRDDAPYDTDFHQSIKERATPFHLSPGESVKLELSLIE